MQRALELSRIAALVLALSLLFGGLVLYFSGTVSVTVQFAAVVHAVVGIALFGLLALVLLLEVAVAPGRALTVVRRAVVPLLMLATLIAIAQWAWARALGPGISMGPPIVACLYVWTAIYLAIAAVRAIRTRDPGRLFDATPQVVLLFTVLSFVLVTGGGGFKSGTPRLREVHGLAGLFLIAYLLRGVVASSRTANAMSRWSATVRALGRWAIPAAALALVPQLAGMIGAIPFEPYRAAATQPLPDLGPTRISLESGHTLDRTQYERLAETCGDYNCHPTHVRDWEHSTHRRAATDPLYLASLEQLTTERGDKNGHWCEGCHSPADLVMDDGSNLRTGIDCLSCHLVSSYTTDGNASFTWRDLVARDEEYLGEPGSALYMYLVSALPQLHKQQFDVTHLQKSEFCESCHRIVLPTAVSGHHEEIVLAADYHDMASSTLAGQGFRCQDCHMKQVLDQGAYLMTEHLLVGGGLTDAQLAEDSAMLEMNRRWLAGDVQTRLHAFSSPLPWANPKLQGVERYLDLALDADWEGDELLLTYRVTNSFIGHSFPKLFDLSQVWMEIEVHDQDGSRLAHYGALDARGEIVGPAPRLGATQVDASGTPITHHRVWEIRDIVDRRVLLPDESLSETIPIRLDHRPRGPEITVTARWNFQRTEPGYLAFAAGNDHGPPVHVTLVEERITVPVAPEVAWSSRR